MAGECAGEPRAEQQLGGDNGLGEGGWEKILLKSVLLSSNV